MTNSTAMPNKTNCLYAERRTGTLYAAILDAEARIASNPTDQNYVTQQQRKIADWRREMDELRQEADNSWEPK